MSKFSNEQMIEVDNLLQYLEKTYIGDQPYIKAGKTPINKKEAALLKKAGSTLIGLINDYNESGAVDGLISVPSEDDGQRIKEVALLRIDAIRETLYRNTILNLDGMLIGKMKGYEFRLLMSDILSRHDED